MSVAQIATIVLATLTAFGLPGVVIWFLRDRRRGQAEATVAEETVSADVEIKGIAALEAHLVLVEKAFNAERASKDRQLADQQRQIEQLAADLEHRNAVILELRGEIADLQQRLTAVSDRLTELTDTTDRQET